MEKIRILFYTDVYVSDAPDPELKTWGLSELEKLIEYKTRALAEFEFDLISRHISNQQLSRKLLCNYDEVWVFGVLPFEGQPYELYDSEVQALKDWMDQGGGLFITGDHSIPESSKKCAGDHKTFPNLGRSLGCRIRRARELRVWNGPPTICVDDNANTQEGQGNLDDPELDKDDVAQVLLEFPDPPHRLFWWRVEADGKVIPVQKFPDHGHEGGLILPDISGADWPLGSAAPEIAAQGMDKRFPDKSKIYTLVLAYDGDSARVGRIVADSSFHHYFNLNLGKLVRRLLNGYPEPDSDLDQIAQYFGNLALWLAPRSIRKEMKWGILRRVAEHPEVFEAKGSGVSYLGKVARVVRDLEIGFSDLYRLLAPSKFEAPQNTLDELLNLLVLGKNSFDKITLGEQEFVFGTILSVYQDLTWGTLPEGPGSAERMIHLQLASRQGILLASEEVPALAEKFAFARSTLDDFAEHLTIDSLIKDLGRRTWKMTTNRLTEESAYQTILDRALAAGICAATWDTFVKGNDDGKVKVEVDASGKITGKHMKSGNDIDGQCTEGPLHLIHYTRTDTDGCKYTYDGTIGLVNFPIPGVGAPIPFFIIVGNVHSSCPAKADADDDWVGTHTT